MFPRYFETKEDLYLALFIISYACRLGECLKEISLGVGEMSVVCVGNLR